MLEHINTSKVKPGRVVVLGAKGFVGSHAVKHLLQDGVEAVSLGREDVDLSAGDAANKLAGLLRSDDALVVVSAKAPCKNYDMLLDNIVMMKSVCDALTQQPVKQVIYISSDAVYTDSMDRLGESSPAAPTSLHGVMHLAREEMLRSVVPEKALTILRPSLLYGAADPHNGYGPNSFYRLAAKGENIKLFGNGEELRDHVYIEDVAEIISLCLWHQSYGVLNITTGEVISFHDIAEKVNHIFNDAIEIQTSPRSGPMPHNGYRAFDVSVINKAFPGFVYTQFSDGIRKVHDHCSGAE